MNKKEIEKKKGHRGSQSLELPSKELFHVSRIQIKHLGSSA